ncbi:MAG: hypothetical protein GY765_00505 [bacterium]|nr:hypothetical protein [bacterium]
MRRKQLFLYFLLFLSATFLFVEYFHTETTISVFDNCPVCQWERSFFSPGALYFLVLAFALILLYTVALSQNAVKYSDVDKQYLSRAPPIISLSK